MSNDAMTPTAVVTITQPTLADAAPMWELAKAAASLDLNSSYAYVLWCDQFRTTSAVARLGEDVIGFVTGFVPPGEPDTLMIWQIAVSDSHRGCGIGLALLNAVLDSDGGPSFRWLKTTIGRSNGGSRALFTALADQRQASCSRTFGYSADLFPDAHEAEDLCTIGPFSS